MTLNALMKNAPRRRSALALDLTPKKKTVGKYLESIAIYEFRMKCPNCKSEMVIRTDPKTCDYVYVSGIKKLFSEYLDSKKKERK